MKLITELVEDVTVREIEEEAPVGGKKKYMYIEGIFLQGNKPNRNGRSYDTNILEREVARYTKENIERNRGYGELGHPNGPGINAERISHRIVELKRDGDNFIGKAQLSSTPYGEIAKGLISDGGQLGVSSRGMGSIKEGKNGVMEVQDDFYLATPADIVIDPSAPDAFVNGIMEGVEYMWDHGKLVECCAEQAQREINEASRRKKLNEQAKMRIFSKFLNSLEKMDFTK